MFSVLNIVHLSIFHAEDTIAPMLKRQKSESEIWRKDIISLLVSRYTYGRSAPYVTVFYFAVVVTLLISFRN